MSSPEGVAVAHTHVDTKLMSIVENQNTSHLSVVSITTPGGTGSAENIKYLCLLIWQMTLLCFRTVLAQQNPKSRSISVMVIVQRHVRGDRQRHHQNHNPIV